MTTIHFKRSGGVLGQKITASFDLDEMPGDAAQRLHNLINATRFFATPVSGVAGAAPDEFEYTVRIEAGQSMHTVRATDSQMPESLRPLIEELSVLAKTSEK